MESPLDSKILTEKFKGLDYLNISVALVDSGFNVLHYNAAFVRLFQSANDGSPPRDFYKLFENFHDKIESLKQVGLESGHLLNFVIPALKLFNFERFFDLHVNKLARETNGIEGFSITCIEVSDRVKELRRLDEISSRHLKFLQFTSSAVIIHMNGKIVYANEQAHTMIGAVEGDSLLGMEIMNFVSDEFKKLAYERIKAMSEGKSLVEPIEEQLIKLDGNILDTEIFAFPIEFEGKPAIQTIITDITEKKKAERELKASENKYQNLVENSKDVIFKIDDQFRFTYLNPAWQSISGFRNADSLQTSLLDYFDDPGQKANIVAALKKLDLVGVKEDADEYCMRTSAGTCRYVRLQLFPVRDEFTDQNQFGGLITDIHEATTAKKQLQRVEEVLKKQQTILVDLARSREVVEGDFDLALQKIAKVAAESLEVSRVNIWQLNPEGNGFINLVNYDNIQKRFDSSAGVTIENCPLYLKALLEEKFIVGNDCRNDERYREFLDDYILPNQIFSMMDSCIISQDTVWGALCFDQVDTLRKWTVEEQLFVNSLAGFIAFAFESSQKKQAQQALNHSEELYQYIVENASEAICIINPADLIIESNQLTEELTGYQKSEIASLSLSEVFTPLENGEELIESIRRNGVFSGVVKFVRKNGEKGIADIHASTYPDGNIQMIVRDITEQHKQAIALKESETRLELALKGADLGTWDYLIREDKMIHNKRWAEMLGYSFEFNVVNGQFWEKFVHPEDIGTANDIFQRHLRGEIPYYEATVRMLASNGEWRWILDKGRVVEWDENGEPIRASGIHQDINELKIYERELQQQRLFLQQILNIIPYPIYVRNINNEFVLINKAFSEMLGYAKNEILQYQFLKKIDLDNSLRKLLEIDNDIFLSKLPIHYSEIKYESGKTGNTHWLQTIKVPLRDSEGNLTELLSVSTDITELKNKEKELASLNEELEVKVNRRTALLEAANKELETFNYSVSHDLRTPLRTIDIFAYFLEKNYGNVLDEEGSANITQIRQSIVKMTALIDNLLIYSKMGRMDIHNTRFNLGELIKEAVAEVSKQMDTTKVDFKYGEMPEVNTDNNLLKQAIVNLVSNAVKFSSTRTLPVVEFAGEIQGRTITLSIKDNGVGFSMEFKEKLFKAFKRLHSEEHFEGSGVGLAIVEKIVKRLHGRIWAESEENTGTTFFISLPQ